MLHSCPSLIVWEGQVLAELRPTHPGTGHKLSVSKEIGWTKMAGSRPTIEPKGVVYPSPHEYGKYLTALNSYTNLLNYHIRPWPRYARPWYSKSGPVQMPRGGG